MTIPKWAPVALLVALAACGSPTEPEPARTVCTYAVAYETDVNVFLRDSTEWWACDEIRVLRIRVEVTV